MTTTQQPSSSSPSMVTLRLPSHILKNLPTPATPTSTKKRSTLSTATPKPSAVSSPAPPDDDQTKTAKGPKGNAGPMNAQLRALDRSGAPTRKWVKHPIPFKSFSGFSYTMNCWASVTPKTDDDNTEQSIKQEEGVHAESIVNPTPTPAPEDA